MHIKQLSIVYSELAPYIILEQDQIQGVVNQPGGVGNLTTELDIAELKTYYDIFQKQVIAEGSYFNFSKSVYIKNGQPHDCIVIDAAPTPPPVTPVVLRTIKVTNNRTAGDFGIVLACISSSFGLTLVQEGTTEFAQFWDNRSAPDTIITFWGNSGDLVTGGYFPLSTPVLVNIKRAGVVLQTKLTTGTPNESSVYIAPGNIYDTFDEIEINDAAAPPPTKQGVLKVESTDPDIYINDPITGITNSGVIFPVNNSFSLGLWEGFTGGFNAITIDVTCTAPIFLEIVVYYDNVPNGEMWNLPGTGIYTIPALSNPVDGAEIKILVRKIG
jgi:hypothetical protein